MIIYYSNTSPFARKVSMFCKIVNQPEVTWTKANPMESAELRKANPLGKVPALVDSDITLIESTLICDYLDELQISRGGRSVFRKRETSYFPVQVNAAKANGIIDAAVSTVMEQRRSDAEQSSFWLNRWEVAILTSLKNIDLNQCGSLDEPNFATISLAAALGYLDFRLPTLDWRQKTPELAPWLENISSANWYAQTMPEMDVS